MRIYDVILDSEKAAVVEFLDRFNLEYEDDIDDTIVLKDGDTIYATASTAHNVIKCVAVDENLRGQNLLGTLITEIIKRLNAKGIDHYFVYTLDEHVERFRALGFKPIVTTMTLAVLEGGGSITKRLQTLVKTYQLSDQPKAAVVVNANPMTLGHLHLIKTAASMYDRLLVFVVSEDRSVFPFDARFSIVKKACEPYENITVLPTLDYLVSYASFPKYFQKEESKLKEEHALIDVLIYKQYYTKIFNIVKRFVGEEPYSPMTQIYNETMRKHLTAHLEILPRLTKENQAVSASHVRTLLKTQSLEAVKPYVPNATLAFLQSKEGKRIIQALKDYERRH